MRHYRLSGAPPRSLQEVQTELVAEVRENVSTTPGREVFRFVPARLLEQGQVVYYTVRITNQTTVPLRNVAVVQPVPANTVYMADSAAGPGANVSFSIDGGHAFAPADALTVELDGTQAAGAARAVHAHPLAAAQSARAGRDCAGALSRDVPVARRHAMHDYGDLFGAEGPLAAAIPGFATREEQIAMAEQVRSRCARMAG